MKHISTKSTIMLVDVELRFADVYRKPYFAVECSEEIKNANLLLIPSENIREGLEPVFPELTSDFLYYLRTHAGKDVHVDIAVNDEHYRKLVLHASSVALATILVREEILGQCADLITGFLQETAKKNHRDEAEMDAFVNIIVEGKERCRKIMFTGRVSELKAALDTAITKEFHEVAR